jgi:hypothetical protein
VDRTIAMNGSHNENQKTQIQGARILAYAIITQAYADVKRYWKYLISQPRFVWKPYHRIVQENYLRREYERSIEFFTEPYAGGHSYMEYLLSLTGEEGTPFAGMVETVLRLKGEVERLSSGTSQTFSNGNYTEIPGRAAPSLPLEQMALR